MPYDLTYMWNLINKTNKQNRTRGTEVRNNLTVTRGEVGGDNGDTWTKPRGEGTQGREVGMAGVGGRVG